MMCYWVGGVWFFFWGGGQQKQLTVNTNKDLQKKIVQFIAPVFCKNRIKKKMLKLKYICLFLISMKKMAILKHVLRVTEP